MQWAHQRKRQKSTRANPSIKKVVLSMSIMGNQKDVYQRPRYALSSVDNALRLIQILRDTGGARLSDVARELDISPSAAHRLLTMLVYRDFAAQDETRAYVPGPSMGAPPSPTPWTRKLKNLLHSHLELLAGRLDESVSLMFRTGARTRVITTLEGGQLLRVGDRTGLVQDARLAAGGKAILARHDQAFLERLYRSHSAKLAGSYLSEAEFGRLTRTLEETRRLGYALNQEETESGLHALGMALHGAGGGVLASFSVLVPSSRADVLRRPTTRALMTEAQTEMDLEIQTARLSLQA
ncbi:IclR family transcriptional regulator [Arthrobacter ginsengisoli]|uniref:IclR family transcriptional regulator n=1 Tax=Arthrobacter ginsengisoli TaxID=1356565 RepID=UPI00286AD64B|nr:IclR family transcriptional regulator C-terminal domain-containing protein [Arthrobacter ginsengisoli]